MKNFSFSFECPPPPPLTIHNFKFYRQLFLWTPCSGRGWVFKRYVKQFLYRIRRGIFNKIVNNHKKNSRKEWILLNSKLCIGTCRTYYLCNIINWCGLWHETITSLHILQYFADFLNFIIIYSNYSRFIIDIIIFKNNPITSVNQIYVNVVCFNGRYLGTGRPNCRYIYFIGRLDANKCWLVFMYIDKEESWWNTKKKSPEIFLLHKSVLW